MKKTLAILLICVLAVGVLAGCGGDTTTETASPDTSTPVSEEPVTSKGTIILSTTTSTQDSGLLEYILPDFTEKTGWEVDTIAVGTGAALQMGRDGEADVLLVHAKADEEKFVEEGAGLERFDVMYNDFIIVGPKDGTIEHNEDVETTFKTIFDNSLTFVSRGDDSGTHKKELAIWKKLGLEPGASSGYVSVGDGMGATLGMAAEKDGYCLTDRATWLTFKDKGNLDIICEKSTDLLNYYGVIAVNPEINDKISAEGAQAFIDWILSEETQELIASFGVEEFGASLFTPNAK